MKTLAERTQQLLDDLEIDQVQLAALAGVTKGAVNQWLKSKPTAIMSPEPAFSIADKTDYEPRWLMIGQGQEKKVKEDKRKKQVDAIWDMTDDRGRTTIFRAAQSQQPYDVERDETSNGSV